MGKIAPGSWLSTCKQKSRQSYRWVSFSEHACVCFSVCVYLQPVQLGPQAALMQRLFELHLDSRQEVPPYWAGKWLTHHHSGSAEVHLTTSDITHSLSSLGKWLKSDCQLSQNEVKMHFSLWRRRVQAETECLVPLWGLDVTLQYVNVCWPLTSRLVSSLTQPPSVFPLSWLW